MEKGIIMKKGLKMVFASMLAVGILSGCSAKKTDNVVPKVEGNPVKVEEPVKEEEPVKVEKIGIIGAWQREFEGAPEMLVFREDGTATVFGSTSQIIGQPNYVLDLLYEVKEVEKDIYSVNLYNVMIDTTDASENKLIKGSNFDTMTINIIDDKNFQGAYKSYAEIFDYKMINSTMADSMMGTSIFSDKGYKSIEITADYLKLQSSELKSFEYVGIQGDAYKEYFVFSTTFGGTTITSYYVNTADLRLFTESEYFNLNP